MKNILLFLIAILSVVFLNAQVVFEISNNSCNVDFFGNINYEYAGNLDGSSPDWNCPNMYLASNAIQGCLVMVNDGGVVGQTDSYGNQTINDACNSPFSQDLTGNIAVCYRGQCEFGLKAFNVQERGAIGLIIINHSGDAIEMIGGLYGVNVNIPVIMISENDGNVLASCLDTVCNGMEGFIGTVVGQNANDMMTANEFCIWTDSYGIPDFMTSTANNFSLDFGFRMFNIGNLGQNDITASVFLDFEGDTIYANTSVAMNFDAPDTNYVDTQFVNLGTYIPLIKLDTGIYTVTYVINNPNIDENLMNNVVSSQFNVNYYLDSLIYRWTYSKSRLDNQFSPIFNQGNSINSNLTMYDGWEACIHMLTPSVLPQTHYVNHLEFSCQPVGNSMAGELIEVKAYEWTDNFININDSIISFGSWMLNEVGSGSFFYVDETMDGVNINVEFETPFILTESSRYLFCIYNESDSLKISYDGGIDYTETVSNYEQPISPVRIYSVGQYENHINGFGFDLNPSLAVHIAGAHIDIETSVNELKSKEVVFPFPNPSSNLITIPHLNKTKGNVLIEVYDLSGKLIFAEDKVLKDELCQINVTSIPNGNYIFRISSSDGVLNNFKISINR